MAEFGSIAMATVLYGFHGFPTVPGNRNSLGIRGFAGGFSYGSLYITPSFYIFPCFWVCVLGVLGTVAGIALQPSDTKGVTVFLRSRTIGNRSNRKEIF
jgi:hypothetical protein